MRSTIKKKEGFKHIERKKNNCSPISKLVQWPLLLLNLCIARAKVFYNEVVKVTFIFYYKPLIWNTRYVRAGSTIYTPACIENIYSRKRSWTVSSGTALKSQSKHYKFKSTKAYSFTKRELFSYLQIWTKFTVKYREYSNSTYPFL